MIDRPILNGSLFNRKSVEPPASGPNAKACTTSEFTSGAVFSPPRTRSGAPATSYAAAKLAAKGARRQIDIVLDYIASCGESGATDEEGMTATGLRQQSYTPRRIDLRNAGFTVDSGQRRHTSSGSPAIVWVAAAFAPIERQIDGVKP